MGNVVEDDQPPDLLHFAGNEGRDGDIDGGGTFRSIKSELVQMMDLYFVASAFQLFH